MVQNNIFRNYNFILDLGAGPVGYFTAASGLSTHIETINYREGVAATEGTKRTDKVAYGDVTLKYGLTESRELWDLFNTAMTGELSPRHLSIILVEPSEQTKKHDGTLCKFNAAALDTLGNEMAIDTLTLTYEGIERV